MAQFQNGFRGGEKFSDYFNQFSPFILKFKTRKSDVVFLKMHTINLFSDADAAQTQNARRPHGPSRPLRGILYAQQREDGTRAFSNWRGGADDVRSGFVGG